MELILTVMERLPACSKSIKESGYVKIATLVRGISCKIYYGTTETEIDSITCDSREVLPGGCFVCMPGYESNGEDYISEAVKRGAVSVLTQIDAVSAGIIAGRFYDFPWRKMILTGITGTKGKTTVTEYIQQVFSKTGISCGTIGTLGVKLPWKEEYIPLKNTTPDVFSLNKYLYLLREEGCTHVVMEVSSQAIKDKRVSGIQYDYGLFTNIGRDHIGKNEHKDLQDYMTTKAKLFRCCRYGIVNRDDVAYPVIKNMATCQLYTYGFDQKQNITFLDYNHRLTEIVCFLQGIPEMITKQVLLHATAKGRMEFVPVRKPYQVLIDYAHNESSMENILSYVRKNTKGRILTVFGCGGNRSVLRRKTMGKVAGRLSDFCILTEDNSRYEDVSDILSEIEKGVKEEQGQYVIIPDRRKAIIYAMKKARENDLILLLGKGHELYLEKNGKKYPFDERKIVLEEAKNT